MSDQIVDKQELSFDIKITNGAAKRLSDLKKHFKFDTAKEVVGLSLELLDAIKDGKDIIVNKEDGSAKRLTITPDKSDDKKA